MFKNFKKTLPFAGLCTLLLSVQFYCTKKDIIKEVVGIPASNAFEKPLSQVKGTARKYPKKDGRALDMTTIYCGGNATSDYYGTGFYTYPYLPFDVSSTQKGSTIKMTVTSHSVPNRFMIYDANNNLIASSGWDIPHQVGLGEGQD